MYLMSTSGCKIEVLSERYALDGRETRYESLDDRLLTRWTGADGTEAIGYRKLTGAFNKRLLRTVYDEHGRDTTANRVESDHEALTGDDDLLREEVLDDLRADGIDADALQQDLISWSTMRTHLKSCLEGEKVLREAESDWERRSVEIAKHIATAKVEEALPSLESDGALAGGEDADVDIQVLLSCPDCPTRIPFNDAVDRGFVCAEHTPGVAVPEGEH
jgi:DNA-binding transcriptional ArsR family regulator